MGFGKLLKIGAALATLGFAGQASAVAIPAEDGDWDCADVTFSVSYTGACFGSVNPPPNDSLDVINAVFSTSFTEEFKDNWTDVGAGSEVAEIDAVGTSNSGGYILFNSSFSDFVLVIKLGQGWSAYRFDSITAGTQLDYTVNLTNTQGLGLSHGTAYGSPSEVPEPTSLALLGLGLAGLGLARRRRS